MSIMLTPLQEALVSAFNFQDRKGFTACFSEKAVVHDEGGEHCGRAAIGAWFDDVSQKYQSKMAVNKVEAQPGGVILTADIAGNFDGSPIELRYFLTIETGLITALTIKP